MDLSPYRTYSNVPSSTGSRRDEEEALKWAALERLPTYKRVHKGMLHGVGGELREIDLHELGVQQRRDLLERLVKSVDDNEKYLHKLKTRLDRVSLNRPTIEVRFENLNVDVEAYVGTRALPSIPNSIANFLEGAANKLHILPSQKRRFSVLGGVSGIIRPGRLTLLLGPPASGKTTLLQALSGQLHSALKFTGRVSYNGYELHEFVPQRTSAYISQYDMHIPQLTVRETLAFSARCQGVGTNYDMLTELLRREKQLNIQPDPFLDALMKVSVLEGQKEYITTEYVLKILGLDVCGDTVVGNNMLRGISGGEKKRVTIGEMLVGPVNSLFMDNISTGLDSSSTFQIMKSIRQLIHMFNKTALVSLLQPPPETFQLFDDLILVAEGQIVYQGPREQVLDFFEYMGFKCPKRKGIADFLQEVTSLKDQRQYWANALRPYHYISVKEFSGAFTSYHLGTAIRNELSTPFNRPTSHPAALTRSRYGTNNKELLKACLSREALLMRRSAYLHISKVIQFEIGAIIVATVFVQAKKHHDTIEDGIVFMGALYFGINVIMFTGFFELPTTIEKLPIYYKQRDLLFYPSWAFSLPISVLGIPVSILEVTLWMCTTYYVIGFEPDISRFFKQFLVLALSGQMSYGLFRCIATLSRDHVVASISACLVLIWMTTFGGFILSRVNMKKWLLWGFWTSPMMYMQTAISANEFLGESWSSVVNATGETVGKAVLESRGLFTEPIWYWIAVFALTAFIILFILISTLALAYLNPIGIGIGQGKSMSLSEDSTLEENDLACKSRSKGMLLPFTPLSVAFENVRYSVDMPKEMKSDLVLEDKLELVKGVSGAFRPGVLTALMGVSGAGKTTLLDVLAGRKNSGHVEGSIKISGYPKNQDTFARVSGYCEQNDIHSPLLTVYESIVYSAWLRLPLDVDSATREIFVEQVMELIELTPLRDALVGLPNVSGLSIEQRKRLTIAIELVANPSIIFMDEPTSGLDARAAAIVMRTVRNTVDTGRTVVCTIHQPSIDIFESFDELFLMTRGGEEIYVGPLGHQSHNLINYFQGIRGVERIRDGYNPATWVLEMTTRGQEDVLGVKFAEEYKKSELYRRNKALIEELSKPSLGSQDIHFPTTYSQPYLTQFKACMWKQHKSYWRNTPYSAARLLFSLIVGIIFGVAFWNLGSKRSTKQDIFNGVGVMYSSIMFMGSMSSGSVRPIIISERTVYYRERASGMYSALPYAIAQVLIEIPYTLIQVLTYGVLVYCMIGYEWTATKFLLYIFFMFITILNFVYFGMMVIAVSPNQEMAVVVSGLFYSSWNIFSGFIIPRQRIVVWWRWYSWICPVAWSFYGMTVGQYGDVEEKMESGETVAHFVNHYFGFTYHLLWLVVFALIAFALLFVSVFILSTKFFNFHRR